MNDNKQAANVSIRFTVDNDKVIHVIAAKAELYKAGIRFDSGMVIDNEPTTKIDWELDKSRSDNVEVRLVEFRK